MSSDDKTPCDCYEPDCDECNQHLEEQAEDKEESDFFADIIEKEDNSERAEGDDYHKSVYQNNTDYNIATTEPLAKLHMM